MRSFSLVFTLMVAALVAPCFTACSRQKPSAPASVPEAGTQSAPVTEMRYGMSSEPVSLDPLHPGNSADGKSILFNVFEGLVKPVPDGSLRPCVAESVTVDNAGSVYRFTLRENIRFHDNTPLTAADVQFSLETAARAGFIGLDALDKIETDGDFNIQLTLKQPDPEFLPYLTVGIVKAGSTDRNQTPVGTGPYCVENYAVQQSLTLRKFDGYWQQGVPVLDKITLVFFADSDALILGLEGGSIDGAGLAGSQAQQLTTGRFDIITGYSAMVQLLALNNSTAPLDDVRVRQAINYGIDIQAIIDAAFYGHGTPSGSPLIPGLTAYYEPSLANPYPVNPEKARSLLTEAGYGDGGQKLSLEITVPSNYTMHVDTAQVIAGQLKKIGIDVTIKLVDWASWLSEVYRGRKYQATIISLDGPNVSPRSFLSRYRSNDGSNFVNFKNAAFDRVYQAIQSETDGDSRIALYKEAQRIISHNAASVYIQDIVSFHAFRSGAYGGLLNYPLYVIDFASMYGK